eukprot:CAMPEP_0118640524 /NCGR_PEP_ID=MMETSP0785-20121206/4800_1 /TAXON_ID=91992 /ORGANISM="Bolidomonas pacifica, Strain CCMP 1866" /LENGTH=244 /DNA_ID=CAMNT_0006531919 /DNA_START=54 /DNA_END=785 /DNA_ORIENTATION=+
MANIVSEHVSSNRLTKIRKVSVTSLDSIDDTTPSSPPKTISEEIFEAIGWDVENSRVTGANSLLAYGTWEDCQKAIATACTPWLGEDCGALINKWHKSLGAVHASDPTVKSLDLRILVKSLQSIGLIVCICTSDSKEGALGALKRWGILEMIGESNILTCTDVHSSEAKPNPYPVNYFCKKHNCKPSETVVIGDTLGDTGLGRNAKVGLTVGVLSGSGTERELREGGADIVLPDVSHFLGWIQG